MAVIKSVFSARSSWSYDSTNNLYMLNDTQGDQIRFDNFSK